MDLNLVTTLEGHSDKAWSIAWHPTQPLIASCSGDKAIRLAIFKLNNTQSITFVRPSSTALPLNHTRTVRSIAWNPTENILASASFDSTIGLWESVAEQGIDDNDMANASLDLDSWECVSSLEGHESEVKAVAWNHDGRLLATCGRDKSVWIWEYDSDSGEFECLAVLMDHTQDVKHVAWHPKEDILASASYDDTIRIYQADLSTDDWACSHTLASQPPSAGLSMNNPAGASLDGHTSTVWAVCFSPCGRFLASCAADATIRIWERIILTNEQLPDKTTVYRIGASDKERWTCALVIAGYFQRTLYCLDWSTHMNLSLDCTSLGCIAVTGSDGKIAVFEIKYKKDEQGLGPASSKCLEYELRAQIEEAHGIEEVNAIKWCNSVPLRPPQSDLEDEDEQESNEIWQRKWSEATLGLLATAGDEGLVKIWKVK